MRRSSERTRQAFQLAAFFAAWLALVVVILAAAVDPTLRWRYAIKFGFAGLVLLVVLVAAWRRGPEAMRPRPRVEPAPRRGRISGAGLREALAVAIGSMSIMLSIVVLVTNGHVSFGALGVGAFLLAGGLFEHRRARRADAATRAGTDRTTDR